jgi:twitching motility protein PilT
LLNKILSGAVSYRGSDVHLRADAPPFVRVDGTLTRANSANLTPQEVEEIITSASGRNPAQSQRADWEFSYELGSSRFRGHVFRENGRWAVTFRSIPTAVPTFQELRMPPVVKVLADTSPGLVLITGPTGSGKTTSAAAMLRHMANAKSLHVVSIEDPVEYRLADTKSCVSQREVGRDTPSYSDALKAVLREDPDVIFIGEIRDSASLEVAIQAAETGHAVISTFHTGNALQTVQRLLGMLPTDDQAGARERLADSLRGIICQRLLPRKGSRGRVLCTEVMLNNFSARECIRDPSKLKALVSVMERSADKQMHTLDQDLLALVREGLVDTETAMLHASSPNDLKRNLGMHGMMT